MRCINKLITILVCCSLFLSGCGSLSYSSPYEIHSDTSSMNLLSTQGDKKADSFASGLCVIDTTDLLGDGSLDLTTSEGAAVFSLSTEEVLYAKNVHERLYPASITKIMTALVAIENGSMDQTLTATDNIKVTENGAQLLGLRTGDSMTLYQALRILLLYSANDVANLIAENIGGSIDGFVAMMNDRAVELGATNTHFMNPHGLTDEEHYTTPYDLYLIFNQCIKYEAFNEIISTLSYETTYPDKNGIMNEVKVTNSNGFLKGKYSAPMGVTVIGGKTGTTSAAGHCLIVYAKDGGGSPYIAVVLKSESTDSLYDDMADVLGLIVGS